jgi:hypothetical protein
MSDMENKQSPMKGKRMSESTPAVKPDTGATVKTEPVNELEAARADAEKWRALSRKHEAQAKENADAAARLAQIEESTKSETQKAADRAAKAEARVAELEAAAQVAEWKFQVATATGIPATVLHGDSLEAITAHAQAITALTGVKPAAVPNEGKLTTPNTTQGGDKATFAKVLFSSQ